MKLRTALLGLGLAVLPSCATPAPLVPAPELAPPWSCTRVENTDSAWVDRLRADGHSVEYLGDMGLWLVDGQPLGSAPAEDEPFAACATTDIIQAIDSVVVLAPVVVR